MTYRERRQHRAERLQAWAEQRKAKADASYQRCTEIASNIPAGQPILVGHHSEKRHRKDLERMDSAMAHQLEHQQKAEDMEARAENITSQLDRSIYSDDPDAIEQLQRRVAELEAERDGIKAFNVSCRKGEPDAGLVPLKHRHDVGSRYMSKDGQFPPYVLSNLNGNIRRNRKRLEQLQRRAQQGRQGGR